MSEDIDPDNVPCPAATLASCCHTRAARSDLSRKTSPCHRLFSGDFTIEMQRRWLTAAPGHCSVHNDACGRLCSQGQQRSRLAGQRGSSRGRTTSKNATTAACPASQRRQETASARGGSRAVAVEQVVCRQRRRQRPDNASCLPPVGSCLAVCDKSLRQPSAGGVGITQLHLYTTLPERKSWPECAAVHARQFVGFQN